MEQSAQNIGLVQAILRYTFGLVPIVAGLDKFTNLLTHWADYVSPGIQGMLPVEVGTWMMVVGVVEISAGALTLARPRIGSLVVAAWLAVIALVLIASGSHLDVAVRDLVMAISAFCLSKLSE